MKTKTKETALSSFRQYYNSHQQNLSKELAALASLSKNKDIVIQASLSKNKDIVIQKSDNGNSVDVVDKEAYIKRMESSFK